MTQNGCRDRDRNAGPERGGNQDASGEGSQSRDASGQRGQGRVGSCDRDQGRDGGWERGQGRADGCVRDRGSISLLMVVVGVVFVVALIGGIGLGNARIARHRAQNAADAGALAGAVWAVDGPAAACAVADRVVSASDARLVSCAVDGLDVRVTVEVRVTDGMPVGRASARAGPVRDTGGVPGDA